MSLTLHLAICLVQILLLANAMEDDRDLTTFLPVHLPYSVKRDEIINVPILVYNIYHKDLDMEITLDNSEEKYEIIDFYNYVIIGPKVTKRARVRAHGTATIYFLIRPKVIGNVLLKFKASSLADIDTMNKTMKVVPEGITKYANHAYFVTLNKKPEYKSSFKLELPKHFVPDSQHIEVGVVGDIMGAVFNNIDNLVRMPTGCGEQTMSFLVSNYLIMKYLMNSKRLTPTMEAKLRYNLNAGYRKMLSYRNTDGSFSIFGPSHAKEKHLNGSTWLTAYVVQFLSQINELYNVNEKIIEEGLAYLSKQQAKNGSFTEKGVYFPTLQRNLLTLTSAAVLAFLENPAYTKKYSRKIAEGVNFIAQNYQSFSTTLDEALTIYTLNKAKHEEAKAMISNLQYVAGTDLVPSPYFGKYLWNHAFATNAETTSYNLLTLLDQKSTKVDDVIRIVKSLIAQRNSLGGFVSTKDTVVGLNALIKFAELSNFEPARMDVNIVSNDKKGTIKLTEENGILYQSIELTSKTNLIEFTAKGNGSAVVQIAYQYNTFESKEDPEPSFIIKANMTNTNRNGFEMLVCVSYVLPREVYNMALLEIFTPSGYVIDDKSLSEMEKLDRVINTELKNSGSLLVVYFDYLYRNVGICLTVKALRSHAVAMQKPASIQLYDYYNTDRNATIFYDVDVKLCNIFPFQKDCRECNSNHTSKPFLSIRLPYSVKKDEIINVPVMVYNYLDEDLDVVITLDNSEDKYEIIDFDNKVISEPKPSKSIVGIRPDNTATVSFLIRPKVVGKVTLKIYAAYLDERDITHTTMNVVKESITQYLNLNVKFDLGKEYQENYEIKIVNIYSKRIEMGIVGDLVGLVLSNLGNLVHTPKCCGEETMSSLLPNYLVMEYLNNLRGLTSTIKDRLRKNLEIGYQKILKYHQMDGSFRSFGPFWAEEKPRNGSTLLTSYVLRFLPQFKEFINVDETIIEEGLAYLSKQQADNGSFIEKGDLFYDSQGNPITLTGAAVLAFLENPAYADKYIRNITKGLDFIAQNLEKYKLLHFHTLATYTSNRTKHEVYKKESLVKWLSETSLDNQNKWWHYVFLSNVEITSNNLLMLLDLNSTQTDNVERVVKRRRSLGFASTQKTVVALAKLIKSYIYEDPAKMDIDIESKDKHKIIKLTEDNRIFYYSAELFLKTREPKVITKGKGTAFVEVIEPKEFFEDQTSFNPNFFMNINMLHSNKSSSHFKMLVCVTYIGKEKFSNIALLEISTPTGYTIGNESLKELQKLKAVGDAKLKNSGSLLVAYFDHIYKYDETCFTLEAFRTHAVAMQKSATIQLYDYFDEDKRDVYFYYVDSKLCDICVTKEECSKCK